jgi:hypothetical protein
MGDEKSDGSIETQVNRDYYSIEMMSRLAITQMTPPGSILAPGEVGGLCVLAGRFARCYWSAFE